ncbi:NB-ARC domain-containing protein [Pseudofrankia sp. DC12]|uniref:NB-ARC domain-containing protein n=1 Tax=Pseudofrankia sp. DC12 TaxID=683315 RepID=UPI0018DB3720|nr:NB-ARC domain-containing protein [Pseudofrankia sp. DC12]
MPDRFVPRPDLLASARALVTLAPERSGPSSGAAPTRSERVVGLVGMGGAGKSTLARALLADAAVQETYPDGLLWVSVGQNPDLASALGHVSSALGDPDPVTDLAAGRERLRRLLGAGRRLLVLDNVWDADVTRAFDLGVPGVRVLATTRNRDVLPDDALVTEVGTVDDRLGRAVLASHAGVAAAQLPPEAGDVLAGCGGLVLALAVAGGMVADGTSWADVADRLRRADLAALRTRFAGYPYPDLLRALDAGVAALPGDGQDRYRELAVFSGRGPVPTEAVVCLWRATAGLGEVAGKELLNRLGRCSLVALDGGTVALHDLAFELVRASLRPEQLRELHGLFAGAFLTDWGGLTDGLALLRARDAIGQPDRYALGELVGHLVEAGRDEEVHALLATQWPGPGGTAENAWFALHERADLPGGYLADIRAAWARAAVPPDAAPASPQRTPPPDGATASDAEQARRLVLTLRYALIHGSVVSRADSLPRPLLRRLVEAGRWPADRALAYARSLTSATSQAAALAAVVPFLPVGRQGAVLDEAWETVATGVDARSRVAALASIGAVLSTDRWSALITEAIGSGLAILDPQDRATELARLASHLPPERRSEATAAALGALATVDDEFQRVHILGTLAPALTVEQLPAALDLTLGIDGAFSRSRALAELAERLPASLLPAAWAALPETPRWSEDARALVALARHLPAPEGAAALARAWVACPRITTHARAPVMAVLAPHLPAADRTAAIAEAWRVAAEVPPAANDTVRASVIAALAPHLTGGLLAEAVEVATTVEEDQYRTEALTALASHVTGAFADRLLAGAATLRHPGRAVAELAPYLPERLLPRARAIVQTVDSPQRRAEVLTGLAPQLPPVPRATVLAAALDAAGAVEAPRARAFALAKLAPQLDETSIGRALALARTIDEPGARVKALTGLLPRLPAHRQAEALREAWDLGQLTAWPGRAEMLVDLAPHLPDDLLATAVAGLPAPELPFGAMLALAALAERLDVAARRAALLPRLDLAQDPYYATVLLVAAGTALTEAERLDRFTAVLDALTDGPLAVVTLEKIGAGLPAELFGRAVEIASSGKHRWGPAQALGGLAPYLPDAVVRGALAATLSLSHAGTRGRALAALAPRLPAELIRQAFAATLAIDSHAGRAEALVGLAAYLPDDLLPAAAEAARPDSSLRAARAVAAAARDPRSADWDQFRAATLADLARCGRGDVIEFLPTMLRAAPDGTSPAAAAATVDAVTDVMRWWP